MEPSFAFSLAFSPSDESIVPFYEKYVLSFYWALSTMSSLGYGQGPLATIVPEYLLAIVAQLTGACVYALIFGNIAQLIQKIDASGARYQQQLDKINEFARFHRLPTNLSKKLREYNNFMFNVSRGFNVEEIAAALPLRPACGAAARHQAATRASVRLPLPTCTGSWSTLLLASCSPVTMVSPLSPPTGT